MSPKTTESAEEKTAREKAAEDRAAEKRARAAFADFKLSPETRYIREFPDDVMLQVANKVFKKAALRKVN
jgi:hypothetical protein